MYSDSSSSRGSSDLILDYFEKNGTYYKPVLKKILGHLSAARKEEDIRNLLKILKEEIDVSKKEDYRSSILITTVSKKEGRNFYLKGEPLLNDNEILELLDDLTGVYITEIKEVIYMLKIKNSQLFERYLKSILSDDSSYPRLKYEDLLEKVNIKKYTKNSIKSINSYSNIALFLILNHFILYILNDRELTRIESYKIDNKEEYLINILLNLRKDLESSYASFSVIQKQKKKKYYIANLSDFISKYYIKDIEDIIKEEHEREYSYIGSFLYSFYITDNEYKDKMLGLLDKLIYYLVFEGKVNFEILSKLIGLFHEYSTSFYKNKKSRKNNSNIIPIKNARDFFIIMTSIYDIQNKKFPIEIYKWAYRIGSVIKESGDENWRDYIDEIIKEIKKEELPGRFLNELNKALYKVKQKIEKNKNINIDLSIKKDLFEEKLYGDKFYMVKSAILAGLINSMYERKEDKES